MSDDTGGHVSLRTYIERMFDERTKTILAQLDLLDEKINRERSYLDEVMNVHLEAHRDTQRLTDNAQTHLEESVGQRVSDLTHLVEEINKGVHDYARRDALDERFQYLQEQIRTIEQNVAELKNLINANTAKRDANMFFMALMFTAINVAINLIAFFH